MHIFVVDLLILGLKGRLQMALLMFFYLIVSKKNKIKKWWYNFKVLYD